MQLYVNPSGDVPIYRQIVRQIAEAVATARLGKHEKLPSHRDLAEQLVIAPMTVKRAYDELEQLGLIATQRGLGTFVCERPRHVDRSQHREEIKAAARFLLSQAYMGGLQLRDVLTLLKEADREVAGARSATGE